MTSSLQMTYPVVTSIATHNQQSARQPANGAAPDTLIPVGQATMFAGESSGLQNVEVYFADNPTPARMILGANGAWLCVADLSAVPTGPLVMQVMGWDSLPGQPSTVWIVLRVVVQVVNPLIPSAVAPPAPAQATAMKPLLSDHFDAGLDLAKWEVGVRPDGSEWGSSAYFVKATDATLFSRAYTTIGSFLRLRAVLDPTFKTPVTRWDQPWFAGMISTCAADKRFPDKVIRKGYVEVRALLPDGLGVWPGFWALNRAAPPAGSVELDGLEYYGVAPKQFVSTVHNWSVNPPAQQYQVAAGLPDLTLAFHTYGFLLDATTMTTFLDGAQVARLPIPRAATIDAFYWMFNLAMGGGWPIVAPPSAQYDLYIDYVRIFSAD